MMALKAASDFGTLFNRSGLISRYAPWPPPLAVGNGAIPVSLITAA